MFVLYTRYRKSYPCLLQPIALQHKFVSVTRILVKLYRYLVMKGC